MNTEHSSQLRLGGWFGSAGGDLRHTCEEADRFQYSWKEHDGVSYGTQDLIDTSSNVKLTTTFLKKPGGSNGGHWSVRITGEKIDKRLKEDSISLYAYFGSEESSATFDLPSKGHKKGINPGQAHLKGSTPQLGNFSIFLKEGRRFVTELTTYKILLMIIQSILKRWIRSNTCQI
jgi:mannosyl-oligosaccharide glucosidase